MKRMLLAAGVLAAGLLAVFLLLGPGAGTVEAPAASVASGAETPSLPTSLAPSPSTPLPRLEGSTEESVEPARLREDLAREIARRVALEAEIAELRRELSIGERKARDLDPESGSGESANEGSDPAQGEGWVDESILLSAGFDPGEAADVRRHLEEIELERLFVRDQATREGWLHKKRFWKEMVQLGLQQAELRDEYGDDGYDWILYASRSDNRVIASAVIQDSPAEQVGLEAGDVIVAYANQRIFEPHGLKTATLSGESGDNVALDVERNGEAIRFYLPVGPIGVRLKTIRQAPRNPR